MPVFAAFVAPEAGCGSVAEHDRYRLAPARGRALGRFAWPREERASTISSWSLGGGDAGAAGGRAPRMLARRIIPCLDVAGRPGREGRALRVAARCRRPGGAGGALRRRRAPTSWSSSTFPRATRRARRPSTWSAGWRSRSSSPSRLVAASARSTMPGAALRAGADKVAVNTAAVRDPDLVRAAGRQLRRPVRGGGGRCQTGQRHGWS